LCHTAIEGGFGTKANKPACEDCLNKEDARQAASNQKAVESKMAAMKVSAPQAVPQVMCETCHKSIDGPALTALGKHYHSTGSCFSCSQCHSAIATGEFGIKAGTVWCQNCMDHHVQEKKDKLAADPDAHCYACKKPITGECLTAEKTMNFHPACFVCSKCKKSLEKGYSMEMSSKSLYCDPCAKSSIRASNTAHKGTPMKTQQKYEGNYTNKPTGMAGGKYLKPGETTMPPSGPAAVLDASKQTANVFDRVAGQKAPGPKFCSSCGHKSEGGSFCMGCGAKL